MAGELTEKYSNKANEPYAGPIYVVNGTLTPEGEALLARLLVSANVERDLLAASQGEIETLRALVKELTKAQTKNFFKGMGVGSGATILIILMIMLLSAGGGQTSAG